MYNIIAIDGPAGSGKSTLARKIAEKTGYKYLDTGAMYRAITYEVLRNKIALDDKKTITKIAEEIKLFISPVKSGEKTQIFVDSTDVTDKIRKPLIDTNVSEVAKILGVRKAMVRQQRKIAKSGDIVVDGRDIGTNVFPEAQYKFYITASLTERAKRRFLESKDNQKTNMKQIKSELKKRDQTDCNRKYSPLVKADDAIFIDTTNLTIKNALNMILKIISKGG